MISPCAGLPEQPEKAKNALNMMDPESLGDSMANMMVMAMDKDRPLCVNLFVGDVDPAIIWNIFLDRPIYGGFRKWWYPTTFGFPTKNDHFGCELGVPPFKETPIYRPYT